MSPFVMVAGVPPTSFTGFASITQSASEESSAWRWGWEFTVGAEALALTHLRVFARNTRTYRVRVHRKNDGVLMASADITATDGSWAQATLGTTVTLAATTTYVVSARGVTEDAVLHAYDPTSHAYASQITYDRSVYDDEGSDPDDMPDDEIAERRYSNCDIRFGLGVTQQYATTSAAASTDTLDDTNWRFGWTFTVGATALSLNRLRVYPQNATTYHVIVHRNSDDHVMAEEDIVVGSGDVDAWNEVTVSPDVTLAASTAYTISLRRKTGSANMNVYRNPTSITHNASITHNGYVRSGADDDRPTTSQINEYWPVDFGFVA